MVLTADLQAQDSSVKRDVKQVRVLTLSFMWNFIIVVTMTQKMSLDCVHTLQI